MHHLIMKGAATATLFAVSGCDEPQPEPPAPPAFEIAAPGPQDPNARIIGGAPADPAQWPATWILDGSCTATMVGERVVITAAHCVGDGATGLLQSRPVPISVTCSHHPRYARDNRFDVALCLTQRAITGVRFERLNTDSARLAVGAAVTILGYGCVVANGPMQSILYVGSTRVHAVPAGTPVFSMRGGAEGCSGDSGGGGYIGNNPRHIVGIMHRGDMSTETDQVSLTFPEVRQFIETWRTQRQVKICGLDQTAANCR